MENAGYKNKKQNGGCLVGWVRKIGKPEG